MGAVGDAEQELTSGELVGEYAVEELLGRGGFGAVYGATHPLIGKRVAIKVLKRKFSDDQEMVSRFVAEARAVNQIRHQHIIDIFSFGRLPDGRHYYVMERLAGTTLDRYLHQRRRLSLPDTLSMLRPLALALDAAHAAGIAHRDLKPENVFVTSDADGLPFPKLLDFGIAKLLDPEPEQVHRTQTGAPMGTPLYMSPEQCRGRGIDHRTDIYAFGVMTYQLLTGQLPFVGEDYLEILNKQINDPPAPPSSRAAGLAKAIDAPVLAMLEKDPARRPATASEALRRVAVAGGVPWTAARSSEAVAVTLPSDSLQQRTTSPSLPAGESLQERSRPRRVWPAVAAITLVVIGGVVTYVMSTRGEDDSPTPSNPPAVVTSPSLDARMIEPPPIVDAIPEPVIVKLVGTPVGARVVRVDDGTQVGIVPGEGTLPFGHQRIELRVEAPEHAIRIYEVTPDRSSVVTIALEPKRAKGVKPRPTNASTSLPPPPAPVVTPAPQDPPTVTPPPTPPVAPPKKKLGIEKVNPYEKTP